MGRLDQRQGFLVSAIVHLVLITMLVSGTALTPAAPPDTAGPRREASPRVFLPPAAVLRQLLPAPAQRPRPRPTPTPAARAKKDRISVGAPSLLHQKGPLELRRDEDLTKVRKGRPDAMPTPSQPRAAAAAPTPAHLPPGDASTEREGTTGLQLPPGFGPAAGREGARRGGPRPLTSSLRELDDRLQHQGPLGAVTGVGEQMGPLYFDPRGADFTAWMNQFKDEVYRNWIVPQSAMLGFGGHVDLQFDVLRDGTLTNLTLLKSSGTASLDRAAQNALLGSRLLPLPPDYGPDKVTMQVTFYYGVGPQGS